MDRISYRPYEVPSYVTSGNIHMHVGHVGSMSPVDKSDADDTLRALILPPLGGYRAYQVPAHVVRGFVHTGAASDSTAPASGENTVVALALVGGVLALIFLVEAGVGYFTYKMSHSVPVSAIIGFLTGGPLGLVAASVGGFAAAKKG